MSQYGNLTYHTRTDPETGLDFPVESRQRVFISYRKADAIAGDLCRRLKDVILEAVDCAVWYDASLTPGENYDQEINAAIRACDVVILLVTEHIFDSMYIWNNEIPWAEQYKKRVIPVDTVSSSELRTRIEEKLGHVQFCLWDYRKEDGGMLFLTQFPLVIQKYVTNASLRLRIEQCFAAGKHLLSRRHLTLEDRYLIGLGYLKGIGTKADLDKAEKTLRSVIQYSESDAELEDLKNDARSQLKDYYQNQILHALRDGRNDLLSDCQRRGEALGLNLLQETGMGLLSVVDLPYKGILSQEQNPSAGFSLLGKGIEYYFHQTPAWDWVSRESIAWAQKLGLGLVSFTASLKDRNTRKIYQNYLLTFCQDLLDALGKMKQPNNADDLRNLTEIVRDHYAKPFREILPDTIPFDVFELHQDPGLARQDLIYGVIFILMILYPAHPDSGYALSHIFYDGKYVERHQDLAMSLMHYVGLMDPARRAEYGRMVQENYHREKILYPRPYEHREDHLPNPAPQGELVIDGTRFYFLKVKPNTMYLMRDDEILDEYPLWVGGGDFSTFSMEYVEAKEMLEILQYEATHYDRDTSRYRICLYDILDEEIRCVETGLPDLPGRVMLPIR